MAEIRRFLFPPSSARVLPFVFRVCSADFQDVAVNGSICGRVTDPVLLAKVIAPGTSLAVFSEMDGGVVFGDGVEDNRLELPFGRSVTEARAAVILRLAS